MRNITLSIEEELYDQVRILAAKQRNSVSGLVRESLKAMVKRKPLATNHGPAEHKQRLRLADLLEQCQIELTERPTREATYAHRRFH